MSEAVRISRHGAVLEVILDRPKANAIDAPTSRRLARSSPRSATIRICASRS